MTLPVLLNSLLLIFAVAFSFYWREHSELSKVSLQMTALLILFYLFHDLLLRHHKSNIKYQNISKAIIYTILTLLLVLSTGGLDSPLLFLLYLLLFDLSLFLRSEEHTSELQS